MSETASDSPVALSPLRDLVGDAVVDVTISFPPLAVPVAEVENWHRNSVIEMGCRLVEVQLSVRAGGRDIGKGYLVVQVEDHVGVVLSDIEA
jgi:flagellar motor switch/type III secretory pathway protein FliN